MGYFIPGRDGKWGWRWLKIVPPPSPSPLSPQGCAFRRKKNAGGCLGGETALLSVKRCYFLRKKRRRPPRRENQIYHSKGVIFSKNAGGHVRRGKTILLPVKRCYFGRKKNRRRPPRRETILFLSRGVILRGKKAGGGRLEGKPFFYCASFHLIWGGIH